jgi:hypothetical protein
LGYSSFFEKVGSNHLKQFLLLSARQFCLFLDYLFWVWRKTWSKMVGPLIL